MTVSPATVPGILQSGIHSARPAATAVASGALYSCSTHRLIYVSDGSSWTTWANFVASAVGVATPVESIIDGGGSAITAGTKAYVEVPFAWSDILSVRLLGDQSGSVVVDVYKCTYSAFDPTTHPASGDKITASAPPTISSAKKAQDTTLTGWTKTGSAGDILAFVVTGSPASITRVTISLVLVRSS